MKQKIKVWDAPLRLFHWLLASAVFFMWFSAEEGGNWLVWHLRCGLFITGLLVFRLIWGVWGSDTAKFSHFIGSPTAIKSYLKGHWQENQHPGHNPLGALMVVALLGALIFQVSTGLFSSDENTFLNSGYLAGWIGDSTASAIRTLHISFFNALLLLIVVHIATIIFYKLLKKHDLIRPMINGYKTLEGTVPQLRFGTWFHLILTYIIALAVIGLIYILKR